MASKGSTVVRVDARLEWKLRETKEGNWIGVCDPLGLVLQGETWADLMEDIGLTLDAVLKDLLSTNELDKFLKDHGWRLMRAIPERRENLRFDFPFIPVMMGSHGSQRNLHQ